MIEPRAEIAYVEPAAAGFTFSRMIGVAQRRAAGHLADDCPARLADHVRSRGDSDRRRARRRGCKPCSRNTPLQSEWRD